MGHMVSESQSHFVIAEGSHINRPLAPPLWEAWASASATQASPETEKSPVDNSQAEATPLTTVKAQAQRVATADGPPPKGPVGRWMDDLPAKQPPPVKPALTTGSYPHNHPTVGQLNAAQQFMPPQGITTSADEPLHVVAPPPDETFIWHCKRHTLPTIGDPCLHCSKWIMPTTRQFVATIQRVEPRSAVMELLINHLFAHRDILTAEQEAAMTTYVARHHLALPVVITAELTTLHSTTPTITPIGHRTSTSTPTVGLGGQAVAKTHATATSTLESPPPPPLRTRRRSSRKLLITCRHLSL